jgi:hypothetical protein
MKIPSSQSSRSFIKFFHHVQRVLLVVGFSWFLVACGGGVTDSNGVIAPPPTGKSDTVAPVVSMSSPANGATITATINISATASDNVGVVSVEFILDDKVILGKATSAPYTVVWDSKAVTNGVHALTAVAVDAAGNLTASTPISVNVSNTTPPPPVGDTVKPTVAISAPLSGAVVSGSVAVSASASDNVGVTLVQFVLNGVTLLKEDTTSPYSFSWDTTLEANGTHTLVAFARDAAGNLASSSPVSVTIVNNNALLTWDANTEPDIAGYRVYYGTSPGNYQQAQGNGIVVLGTSYTVTGLDSRVGYYFTVTAFDASGNESGYATEVFKDTL